jgi:sarcosine oxidase subunit alpha
LSARVADGADSVSIVVDGREASVAAGITVAAAILGMGVAAFRRSVTGEGRAPLCGMGTCHECRLTIDGVAHRRSCLVIVSDGLRVSTAQPGAV